MSLIAALGRNALVKNIKPFFPLLVYVAVAGLLLFVFLSSFRQIEALILQEKLNYLGATAEEKVEEISGWRAMQQRIADSISRNSLLASEFEQWLAEGAPTDRRKQRLIQRLGELRSVNGYRAVVLLDRRGKARLSLPASFVWGEEDVRRAGEAMRDGGVLFSELHRDSEGDKKISIDLVAPLSVAGRVAGAVVLQIDPERSLYPLIREKHFPSESGETLLVRQDGNDALFLNELRHRKDSALTLRLPLSRPKFPPALAIRGETRTTDGIDYRGLPVVAEMRRIPGSSWIVISKIDRAELFGPVTQLENWSAGIALVYGGGGGALVLMWLYGHRARYRHLKEQHAAALERAMLTKHYEYLTRYANDIIMLADEKGHIVEANERAEQAYGYTHEELLRMHVTDFRDTTTDPALFQRQLEQIGQRGELRYEIVHRRKDGTCFPVEVSARVIEVGERRYLQGIARDISERRRAEETLRKSEAMLKESQQQAHIGSWVHDLTNNLLYWSDESYRIFGVDQGKIGASYKAFLNAVHPDDRAMVNEAYTNSVQNRTPYNIVHRLQIPGQPLKYVREWCETYYDAAGKPLRSVGTVQDITEQQIARETLGKSEALLKESQQLAHIGSWELDLVENVLYWSDENYRIFGVDRDRFGASYEAFLNAVHPDDRAMVNEAYTSSVQNRTPYTIVHRLQFPDRPLKYVRECCETYYDAEGKPLRSIGTTQDITEQQLAQNELRESSELIEDLYNHAPCGYHSLDKDGVIMQINDTELQWLGYAREEVVGRKSFLDMLTPASQESFRDSFPRFKSRGFVHDVEYELMRRDGSTFHVSLSATAIYDAAGEYLMSRSTLFDISERRQAEEELRLQGTILSQMEEGVILVRADSGAIIYVNPKFEQMFGYDPGEMLRLHVSSLNAPTIKSPQEEAAAIIAALHDAGRWGGEIYNRKKDGTPFWCHAVISTFEHHRYGTVWVSTHVDITERKQVENKLKESEERFRTMVDRAPILLWMAEARDMPDMPDELGYWGCNFFNQQWHDFTGMPLERALCYGWLDSVHPDDRQQCLETYQRAFVRKHPFKREYRLRRHDGADRWILDSGVPRFTDDGTFLGFIGICIDITDKKLFEDVRERMVHIDRLNIVGEMTSGLAHELSQPLSAANNYLDACLRRMMEDDWDRDAMQKTVKQAQVQTGRAGKIINHLKSLVRKRKQKQKQDLVMVDVNALIGDTLNFLDYELHHNYIQLSLELSPVPLILVSRLEIEQVLLNLVKNAIESMQSSERRDLCIATHTVGAETVMVSVRDSGAGLAADQLEQVFQPFQSSKQEGLGLGLVICRTLIEDYGGRIWAEQNGDGGAEFNFTLPAWGGI